MMAQFAVLRRGIVLIALLAPPLIAQQATTISGHVRGDAGNPLPGATVSIAELGVGATVRESGDYSFTVPANRVRGQAATLTARIIGYRAKSVQITLTGSTITQDFSLEANPFFFV